MTRLWRVGTARNAVFFHGFVASPARKVRRLGCQRCPQSLRHAVARERFGSQSVVKGVRVSVDFLKLDCDKFAPRCGARAIWKSKSLKTERFGRLFEVQVTKN